MTYLATAALFLTAASLLAMTTILFAPFLFGLFLLALAGVIASHGDRRVRRRQPSMDATGWRGEA